MWLEDDRHGTIELTSVNSGVGVMKDEEVNLEEIEVCVMKDEEVNLEEIEVSHTLGGVGRCYTVVIHT